jgi:hypothetical protein
MRHRRKCQFFEIAISNIPFTVSSRNGSADAARELNPLEGVAHWPRPAQSQKTAIGMAKRGSGIDSLTRQPGLRELKY